MNWNIEIRTLGIAAWVGLVVALGSSSLIAQDESKKSLIEFGDLSDWDSLKPGLKERWVVSDDSSISAVEPGANLTRKFEYPGKTEIRFQLEWKQSADYEIVFGVPERITDLDGGVILESWDDAVVLNLGEDFAIVAETIGDEKKVDFRIEIDKEAGKITAEIPGRDRAIAVADFDFDNQRIAEGICITSKSRDLILRNFSVRKLED